MRLAGFCSPQRWHLASATTPANLCVVFLFALATSCSDSTSPGGGRQVVGIRIIAGSGVSDTVDAVLAQALVVEVRDTVGALAGGQVVRFAEVPDTLGALSVAPLAGQVFGSFVAETTTAQGQASVLVRFGAKVGPARLAVSVPAYGFSDTAGFTVLAGKPFRVLIRPSDTAIVVGAAFPLRTAVVDRYGNPRSAPVAYATLDTTVRVSTGGSVTGQTVGLGRIVASATGLLPDTARVSVLPVATIAASTTGGILIVNLDGSGSRSITVPTANYNGRFPSWLSATTIAAMDGQYYARLLRVSTSGGVQYLVPTTDTTVVFEVWPQAARDGSWIFFAGLVPGYSTGGVSVWRIKPTGDSLTRVSPPNVDGVSDTYPSPSPDGSRVAVATTRSGDFTLALIDVATSQLTDLGIPGIAPRWAPAGDTIAYLGGGGEQIWLVSANGSGARRVSQPGRYYVPGMDWSPDRRWIIARGSTSLELVEVATGNVIPLGGLPGDLSQPAWKP